MKVERRLWFAGGLAAMGGVEEVTTTLLLELRALGVDIKIACWTRGSRYLEALSDAGVQVERSWLTRGCRWGLPDVMLGVRALPSLRRADLVVFAKLLPVHVHRCLRALAPRARFVLITPYRPSELAHTEHERAGLSRLLNSFDLLLVQAESFREDLRELGVVSSVRVVPLVPRATGPVVERVADGTVRVGFLGRLAKQKNLGKLIRAFARAKSAWADAGLDSELRFLGEGTEREALEELTRALHIEGNVRFLGALEGARLDEAIDGCDLFALTSHTEGQCLAAMEVLRRGRPIVSTAVGAVPELIVDPVLGEVVDPGSDEDFARALVSLGLGSKRARTSAQERRAIFDAKYDRPSIIGRYADVFRVSEPSALLRPRSGSRG